MRAVEQLNWKSRIFSPVKSQTGMTLIEIMIVLAIVGGLMAVLGQNVSNYFKKAKVDTTKLQMREIGKALDMYNLSCSSYPTSEMGLKALVTPPGESCPNWGPKAYLTKEEKDQWGRAFIYDSDGSNYSLKSLGADGKENGTDFGKDLVYPEETATN